MFGGIPDRDERDAHLHGGRGKHPGWVGRHVRRAWRHGTLYHHGRRPVADHRRVLEATTDFSMLMADVRRRASSVCPGSLRQAHPLAQPAETLVDLDRWVRGGGRVLLLADPRLEWPSERPLGDKLRPPPAFADTGLLAHWGLRLDAPDEAGPRQLQLGSRPIVVWSPGVLSGSCRIGEAGFVARCRIGKGQATVVADADFLNVDLLDGPTENNLDALVAELAALER